MDDRFKKNIEHRILNIEFRSAGNHSPNQLYQLNQPTVTSNHILPITPLSTRLRYDQKNTMGNTNRLKMVLVISPPITTMASGFDASDPIPFDIAAGSRPMAAIRAVMTTGRRRSATPSLIASPKLFQVVW